MNKNLRKRLCRNENQLLDGMRKFSRNRLSMLALVIFIFIVLSCLIWPEISTVDPFKIDVHDLRAVPSREHPLGTDSLGRDLLIRLLLGGQITLGIMATATVIAAVCGSAIGIVSGFFGGDLDFLLMRAVDIIASVPSILLATMIEVAFNFGSGNFKYGIAISAIPAFARIMRAAVLNIMGSEYIEASRALGAGNGRIIGKHVLHNVAVPFLIQLLSTAADTLLTCTIMGYLGIGINPPTPEWGEIVHDTKDYIRLQPYVAMIPGSVVVITEMCLNFIGNGLRDALDPHESGI